MDYGGAASPELFEVVVGSKLRAEEVYNHRAVVEEHPSGVGRPLDVHGPRVLVRHGLVDGVTERLKVTLVFTRGDDEVVGEVRLTAEVEDDDIRGELVGEDLGDTLGDVGRGCYDSRDWFLHVC